MSVFPKSYADRVAKLRVTFGFVLVFLFAWLSRPTAASLSIGLPVSLVGIAVRAWAAGHLEKNRSLAQSGPYAHVRNPLYLGTLLVAAGLLVAAQRWLLVILFAAVFLLVYLPVIELEEQHLGKLFPEFREYSRRVPALLPALGKASSGKRFQSRLYWSNREYQALAGFLAGAVFLIFKAFRVAG